MKSSKKARRIFVDTNVFVGHFREVKADLIAMGKLTKLRDCELYTSALAVAQTISTLQGRKKDTEHRQKIVEYIEWLMHQFNVIGLTDSDIENALHRSEMDIEDNIQFVAGEKAKCFTYITNNKKDFKQYQYNNVRVISPKEIGRLPLTPYSTI